MSAERLAPADERGREAVAIGTVPLRRLRLARALPRYLLWALASAGLIASARFALAPPRALPERVREQRPPAADLAAEGYAVLFARRYLTWNAADPQASERLLASIAGSAMAPAAGLVLPVEGSQSVEWAEVVQDREPGPGAHVFTVAAQIAGRGVTYLAVEVTRAADGRLALSGYPAFVGAPAATGAQPAEPGPETGDRALAAVVRRALRNYLVGATEDLEADLSPGADVAVPAVALTLDAVQRIAWSRDRRSVIATVQAHDDRGTRYTLGYELDVANLGGRWEISAIEMDPRR